MEFDDEGNVVVNSSFENAIKEIAILKKTNLPNIIKFLKYYIAKIIQKFI